jgi:hypothetical protein
MAERFYVPDADHQEQLEPAAPAGADDPVERLITRIDAPEADLLEQETPAGLEPSLQQPVHRRERLAHIPEADALEQAQPADRELFDDDR